MKKLLLLTVFVLISCSKDSADSAPNGPVPMAPTVSTTAIHDVDLTSAKAGGTIVNENGNAITQKGICWSSEPLPTVALASKTEQGGGSEIFEGSISNLIPDTRYYVRAYATNVAGTSYGNQFYFRSRIQTDPVIDYDGNVYQTIKIGNQIWMKENLRNTHYCNGDEIPNNLEPYWNNQTTASWAYYQNDSSHNVPYGKLYNWYVANDSRNPCPCNWHVPTTAEWQTLISYVGDNSGKLKEARVWPWVLGEQDQATNESGFSAWPAGFRGSSNLIFSFGFDTGFWTYGNDYSPTIIHAATNNVDTYAMIGYGTGASIRCIKD